MTQGSPARASPSSLAALTAIGFLSTLVSGFLWSELVVARAGGTPFCGLGEGGCSALWDAAFASGLHRYTGVPVAGWGLAWGTVALVLPLLALLRTAEEREAPELLSAVRITAAAGLLSTFVLLGVAVGERALCPGCLLTYALVSSYAGIALFGWRRLGLPALAPGLGLACGTTLLVYLALLYPGRHTPQAGEGKDSLEAARAASTPAPDAAGVAQAPDLAGFVNSLPPEALQLLSDSLYLYKKAPASPLPPPRSLWGPASAPVRITEFTDVMCSHCANLATVLDSIGQSLPADSFSVEPRQFPLDGRCNTWMQRAAPGEDVRCPAARARICLEGDPQAKAVSDEIFAAQKELTPARIREIVAAHGDWTRIQACVASPDTEKKLQDDIALAKTYGLDGTPLVLVNGRKGTSYGPFLYAMILTKGDATNSAFASLPAPNRNTNMH
jgi:protein-disulfide isomerase